MGGGGGAVHTTIRAQHVRERLRVNKNVLCLHKRARSVNVPLLFWQSFVNALKMF